MQTGEGIIYVAARVANVCQCATARVAVPVAASISNVGAAAAVVANATTVAGVANGALQK